ncbi:hypothetical protein [Methylobacterium bullatum]|uniref:Uncharacterized protein n=1 Tax=Methylobacterium bullatum TaxID=570505 RepID=A0A679K6F8_9HYPH|nr:hypothetical protein MBLL_04235 [Methylobacterium bullatum]
MQPNDPSRQNAEPETFWQQHGDFVIIMSVMLTVILVGFLRSGTPGDAVVSRPSTFGADMKEIGQGLISIVAQIAFLIMLVRVFWPIIRFFGMIIIGGGVMFLLYGKGFI